jgi:hypothetical protein
MSISDDERNVKMIEVNVKMIARTFQSLSSNLNEWKMVSWTVQLQA